MLNKARFLRLGIISTAGISAMSVIHEIRKVDGIVLQAVASRNLKSAQDYAKRYNIPQAYGNYDEMINLPYIDCVYIPLPNHLHCRWVIKALKKQKHVLCEKPMATSLKEANIMLRAQKESGKVLMEAMHYRYHPVVKKFKEIIESGEIGEVYKTTSSFSQWIPLWRLQNSLFKGKFKETISSFFSYFPVEKNIPYNRKLKEGVLLDMGCYTVDAICWIANCKNAKVLSAKTKIMQQGIDCETSADLLFENGVKGSIFVSYRYFSPSYIKADGTKGSVILFSPFLPVVSFGEINIPVYQMWIKKGFFLKPYFFPSDTTYYYQLCAFRDAIITGKEPLTSCKNSLATIKIIEDIIKKANL